MHILALVMPIFAQAGTLECRVTPDLAILTSAVGSGYAPLRVTFDPVESTDDVRIVSRQWDLGDTTTVEVQVAVKRVYAAEGDLHLRGDRYRW